MEERKSVERKKKSRKTTNHLLLLVGALKKMRKMKRKFDLQTTSKLVGVQ